MAEVCEESLGKKLFKSNNHCNNVFLLTLMLFHLFVTAKNEIKDRVFLASGELVSMFYILFHNLRKGQLENISPRIIV